MNYKLRDYIPKNVEFCTVSDSVVPENLGEYKDEDEAVDFVHQNLTAINQSVTASRFMDAFEKKEIRKEYQELLETRIPFLENEVGDAHRENEATKSVLKQARENLTAAFNEVKQLAYEVKQGRVDIHLEDKNTWRVPYANSFYFFTYIGQEIKLAKIQNIPDNEKDELFNGTAKNEDFFKDHFGDDEVPDTE